MIRGIHHISMKCDDPQAFDRAKNFYCSILSMKTVHEWDAGIMIDTGSGLLEIFNNGKGSLQKGALRHIALDVDDTDLYAEKIRAAGYEIFEEPHDVVIPSDPPLPARIAFCYGPLHEEIELFQEK